MKDNALYMNICDFSLDSLDMTDEWNTNITVILYRIQCGKISCRLSRRWVGRQLLEDPYDSLVLRASVAI